MSKLRACSLLSVTILACACRPPYAPRSTPADNAVSPDEFDDRYEGRGPPALVVAPVFDIQPLGVDSMTAAVEVHGYVPKAVAITGYAGYGVFGNSGWRVEAYAGYPLFRSTGYALGRWALSSRGDQRSITVTYKQVNLPVHSMLLVEGGIRLQGLPFAELAMGSRADSLDEDDFASSAVGFVRVGLRRKTFWSVSSSAGTARSLSSWWLHAILPPVGVPDPAMAGGSIYYGGLIGNGEVGTRPVGGAFGMEFPAWATSPVLFRAEFAFLPGPHQLELMIGISLPLHLL